MQLQKNKEFSKKLGWQKNQNRQRWTVTDRNWKDGCHQVLARFYFTKKVLSNSEVWLKNLELENLARVHIYIHCDLALFVLVRSLLFIFRQNIVQRNPMWFVLYKTVQIFLSAMWSFLGKVISQALQLTRQSGYNFLI